MLYFPTCLELRNVSGSFKITQGHSSNSTQLFDGCSTSYCCSVVTVRLTSYMTILTNVRSHLIFNAVFHAENMTDAIITWRKRLGDMRGHFGTFRSVTDGRTDMQNVHPHHACTVSHSKYDVLIDVMAATTTYFFYI